MNHKLLFGILILISLSLISLNCTSDDDNTDSSSIAELHSIVTSETWRITNYNDSGDDETYHYAGYEFIFLTNGNITASKDGTTISGTWSISNSSNSTDDDDGNYSDLDFNIFFASPPAFNDLTDDWDINLINAAKIDLIDVSGGNGGTDLLVFSKN